jgi:hypothetical protein
MFKELKEMLLNQVDCIVELLEYYGFEDIRWTHRELRFRRDAEGGMNISIKLDNNDSLLVHDFARGVSTDIFAYIVKEKEVSLGEVLNKVKELLKLENNWTPKKRVELFGGIYNRIVNKTSGDELLNEYPKSILDAYDFACNERFRNDGISYKTQRYFNIMYDKSSSRIVIPLYDELGRLIGVKGRINRSDIGDDVPKYLYLYECSASKTLYGYYQNYQHLFGNEIIVGESEKMVMQAHSFGAKNVVGLGSNSLSEKQARLLLQMNPTKIIFALDEGLELSQTERNVNILRSCMGIIPVEVYYWDYTKDTTITGTKNSPTDMGKEKYEEILRNQLVKVM